MHFQEFNLEPLQRECERINDKFGLTNVRPITVDWVTPSEVADLELDPRKSPWVRFTDGLWEELAPFVGAVESLRDFAQGIADVIDDEEADTREIEVPLPPSRKI